MKDVTPAECSFVQFAHMFDAHRLKELPWEAQGNDRHMLVVTMPDTNSNIRLTRRATDHGDVYRLETALPTTTAGVTFAAGEKIQGFLDTQRGTKLVTQDTLRSHHVRKILGEVFKLRENREAQHAPLPVPTVTFTPKAIKPKPEGYSANVVERALKLGTFSQLYRGKSDIRVTMPIADAPLIIASAQGNYTLRIESDDAALQDAFAAMLAFQQVEQPISEAALKQLMPKISALYRSHKRDSRPLPSLDRVLPPPKNFEGETVAPQVPEHPLEVVIDALILGKKLAWGPHARYGTECLRVRMPDVSTDVMLVRTHSKDGANHALFPADPVAADADPTMVQTTGEFLQRRTDALSGMIDAESLRYTLEEIGRFRSNVAAAEERSTLRRA